MRIVTGNNECGIEAAAAPHTEKPTCRFYGLEAASPKRESGRRRSLRLLIASTLCAILCAGLGAPSARAQSDPDPTPSVISGAILTADGDPISSVTVAGDNGASSTLTDEMGNYEVSVPYGWTGRITPSCDGWLFVPEYTDYEAVTDDVTGQNYVGEAMTPGDLWNDYTVLYKRNGVATTPTLTTNGIFILNGGERDTLSIKKKHGVAMGTPIGFLRSNGAFTKVYTEGAIDEMQVNGPLKSLTAKGCYVADVSAASVGTVKMAWQGGDEVYTAISTSATLKAKASISLSGVVLQRLYLPAQNVAAVSVAAKKTTMRTDTGKVVFVNTGRIGNTGAGADVEVIQARSIGRIQTWGGEIMPDTIQAAVPKVSAQGVVFTVQDDSGKSFEEHPGDIILTKLRSTAATLALTSVGGDVAVNELAADGRISSLSSNFLRYMDAGAPQYMGGHLGVSGAPSSLQVAAGANKAMPGDILQIHGALAVSGVFMAGVDFAAMPDGQDDVTTPTYRGNILNISARAPSPRLPEDPAIEGEAEVRDGKRLEARLAKLPNAVTLAVYDAANPKS